MNAETSRMALKVDLIDKPCIIPEPFRRHVKGRKREWGFGEGAASLPTSWRVSESTVSTLSGVRGGAPAVK